MEMPKGVKIGYEAGEAYLKIQVKELLEGKLDEVIAKIESGEIDLIKGTDLDKHAALGVVKALKGIL